VPHNVFITSLAGIQTEGFHFKWQSAVSPYC